MQLAEVETCRGIMAAGASPIQALGLCCMGLQARIFIEIVSCLRVHCGFHLW
jgi:hypothetical protein